MGRRRRAAKDRTNAAKGKANAAPFWTARRRGALAIVLAAGVLAAVVAAVLLWPSGEEHPPRAAILDQLSLTIPNPEAVQATTDILVNAGYEVDYFPGEAVTVERYRTLPQEHYDLIILRSHAARLAPGLESSVDFSLFTADRYDKTRYVEEQLAGGLYVGEYLDNADERYFSVTDEFVDSIMQGNFEGATVLIMGCDGMRTPTMARALVRKGASTVIGWNELVSAPHTDQSMERLVRHIAADGLSPLEAVRRTRAELGPDPTYGAILLTAGVGEQ